jgi:hypothetical protein
MSFWPRRPSARRRRALRRYSTSAGSRVYPDFAVSKAASGATYRVGRTAGLHAQKETAGGGLVEGLPICRRHAVPHGRFDETGADDIDPERGKLDAERARQPFHRAGQAGGQGAAGNWPFVDGAGGQGDRAARANGLGGMLAGRQRGPIANVEEGAGRSTPAGPKRKSVAGRLDEMIERAKLGEGGAICWRVGEINRFAAGGAGSCPSATSIRCFCFEAMTPVAFCGAAALATANPSPKLPPSTTTRNPASFIGHVQMFWGCRRDATLASACGAAWNHFPTTGTICGFSC